MSNKNKKLNNPARIFLTDFNAVMYGLLLIATPFVMLQGYLQDTVYSLNRVKFALGFAEVPFLICAFAVAAVGLLIITFKYITLKRLLFFLIAVAMLVFCENITDYYIITNYYDLQNNWHYFAYGIYAYVLYRTMNKHNLPDYKIILYSFLLCISLSSFDEGFQFFLSSRVFDISDIAKDTWGINIGLVMIFFVYKQGEIVSNGWKVRERNIKDYFKNPLALLLFQIIFSISLVFFGSLLSDHAYFIYAIIVTIFFFLFVFLVIHLSQFKKTKIALSILFAALLIALSTSFIINFDNGFTTAHDGLLVYKGIPVVGLDIIISSEGKLHLIDKKKYFNQQDIRYLIEQHPDILIIGSGTDGKGGKGFFMINNEEVHFLFDSQKMTGIQLMILKTPDAALEFNRLAKEGKKVLFVAHNS